MNERGEPQVYEVVWRSGHIDRVRAHQVSWPGQGLALGLPGAGGPVRTGPQQIHFHAEIDGKWLPTLIADEADIQTVRLVTDGERIPTDGGAS